VESLTLDKLDPAQLRHVDVGGVRTRVFEAGSGEPLLLIHGGQYGSFYSLDAWSLNLGPLARHFRVIAFDKLGQGHTGPPAEPDGYTVDSVVAHVDALVEQMGLDGFHVVGHSRGGIPAVHLALTRPHAVRSLVLVDVGSVAPLDPAVPVGAFYSALEPGDIDRRPGREDVTREPEAQAIDPGWITDDFVERMIRIAELPSQQHVRGVFRRVEHDVWRPTLARWRADQLAAIDTDGLRPPTLVIWGFEDRSAPRHLGLRLHERIAARSTDATFLMMNRAGHYVFRDRPAAFERALVAFCQRGPSRHAG
jgi:2-hydroxy-6-oxo-6-(2'-carboxyphenyl)-hexa-2,4-dienoate hydrolase